MGASCTGYKLWSTCEETSCYNLKSTHTLRHYGEIFYHTETLALIYVYDNNGPAELSYRQLNHICTIEPQEISNSNKNWLKVKQIVENVNWILTSIVFNILICSVFLVAWSYWQDNLIIELEFYFFNTVPNLFGNRTSTSLDKTN